MALAGGTAEAAGRPVAAVQNSSKVYSPRPVPNWIAWMAEPNHSLAQGWHRPGGCQLPEKWTAAV